MKKFVVVTVVAFCFLTLSQCVKAEIIWSSGFEFGDFSEWTNASDGWETTNSSSGAHSGSYRASIDGATSLGGDVLLLAESTVGYQDLQWNYWYKVNSGLEEGDHVFAEWSANGGVDWQLLVDYTKVPTSDWRYASFDLPTTADNNPLCQFRFRPALGSASDCMSLDEVSLSAAVPEPHFLFLILPLLLCICRCRAK